MENQEKDGKACCDKSKCCGGKALAIIGLLAIGAVGGFFAGKCHASRCEIPAVSAPSQPAK